MIKLLIADDHTVMLQGLKQLFAGDPDFELCETAQNCSLALQFAKQYKPDVLLTDISFPDGDGISLYKQARMHIPGLKAVCLSMHREQGYVAKAWQAGIQAYLPKETEIDEIKRVVKGVMAGQKFYSPDLFAAYLNQEQQAVSEDTPKLTMREIEIIQLIANGLATKDIADKLSLSPYTVDTHRKNINSKLDVKNVGELIKAAKALGLLV